MQPDCTTPPLKTCTKCGTAKTRGEFSRQSRAKDGLQAQCKTCAAAYRAEHCDERAAYQATYRAEHPEEMRARDAAYRASHREEIAAYTAEHLDEAAAYRAEHREEIAAYKAVYRAEHREETAAYRAERREEDTAYFAAYHVAHREERAAYSAAYRAEHSEELAAYGAAYRAEHRDYMAVWRAENPDKRAAHDHNRRARKLGNGGTHIGADIAAQYARQKGRCIYCGEKVGDTYHVDHVMPLMLGGSNGPENLVIACPTCNLSKGAKHPQDFCGRLL